MDKDLPRGITIRENNNGSGTLYISFTYKGTVCREPLKNVPATAKNIKYAANLKAAIDMAITKQNFKYSDFFPDSRTKTAKYFGGKQTNLTIHQLFKDVVWEDITPKLTTAYTYSKDSKWADDALGHIPAAELSIKDIRDWVKTMSHLKRKTISNRLTPLRIVLAMAVDDQVIDINPADAVSLGKQSKGLVSREQRQSNQTIDPFSADEIDAILKAATEYHPQAKNYYQTAFYTGMRPSELKGLKWFDEDGRPNIDFENDILHVRSACVYIGGKVFEQDPKTQQSLREIDLTPLAREALERQKSLTYEEGEYVFQRFDGGDGHLSHNDHYAKPWTEILKMAGVRYRPAKQTRHTYSSQMLSGGENPAYISAQLGHEDLEMVFKHYGRWIEYARKAKHVFTSTFGQ